MALVQRPISSIGLTAESQAGRAYTLANAAHQPSQIELSLRARSINLDANRLISSPYDDFANQLTLPDLELPYRLFAFALSALEPTTSNYATEPWLEIFNWAEVFGLLRELCRLSGVQWRRTEFYVVIFRSKLKPVIDRERLGLLDQKSHEEACASGGLLKYWFGSPNGERRNLATCLWRGHADAVKGGAGPWHKQARLAAREMYERIDFHVHTLVVEDDANHWELNTYS